MKKTLISIVTTLVLACGLFVLKAYASVGEGMCDALAREYPEEDASCIESEGSKCTFHFEYDENGEHHSGYATVPDKEKKKK